MDKESRFIATECIHAGEEPDPTTGAVVPPIYQTTIFNFPDSEAIEEFMAGRRPGYIYSRYANPTLAVLEKKIAALEGAEAGLSLASGNAATTVSIFLCANTGDHIVCTRNVYGGTYAILTELMAHSGIETTFVDSTILAEVESALRPNTKAVFLESPTNPTMNVSDIKAIAEIAHSKSAKLIVDNSFAEPAHSSCGDDPPRSAERRAREHGDCGRPPPALGRHRGHSGYPRRSRPSPQGLGVLGSKL